MPRVKKQQPAAKDEKLFLKFFELIAKHGAAGVTFPMLARALKMKLPELVKNYAGKQDVLAGFSRYLDMKVADGMEEAGADTPLKEKLFDIFMRRFEALQPFREGLSRLMDDALRDPKLALQLSCLAPSFCRSLGLMLEFSGFKTESLSALPVLAGLKLAYLTTLNVWKNDESHDLTATMAALDRALDRALKLGRVFP